MTKCFKLPYNHYCFRNANTRSRIALSTYASLLEYISTASNSFVMKFLTTRMFQSPKSSKLTYTNTKRVNSTAVRISVRLEPNVKELLWLRRKSETSWLVCLIWLWSPFIMCLSHRSKKTPARLLILLITSTSITIRSVFIFEKKNLN